MRKVLRGWTSLSFTAVSINMEARGSTKPKGFRQPLLDGRGHLGPECKCERQGRCTLSPPWLHHLPSLCRFLLCRGTTSSHPGQVWTHTKWLKISPSSIHVPAIACGKTSKCMGSTSIYNCFHKVCGVVSRKPIALSTFTKIDFLKKETTQTSNSRAGNANPLHSPKAMTTAGGFPTNSDFQE